LFEIGQKLAKYKFLAMNFFFWPTPSKIGQFEQKWPINWPSGIPDVKLQTTHRIPYQDFNLLVIPC
jgi:hypothetical protein